VTLEVATSTQEIPFPYVVDGSLGFGTVSPNELAKHFPTTDLAHIGDEIADALDASLDGGPGATRWRCSTGCAPISAWPAWRTTPAPIRPISSAISCSPTITAMSMVVGGPGASWARTISWR
jgi:hypothetical protein